MYLPAAFKIEDPEVILNLIQENSFATLITAGTEAPLATHLPLVIESTEPLIVAGHVARANPHWQSFDGRQTSLAIFHGPHAYISPRDYASSPNVPTWNYAVVHAYGQPVVVEDADEVFAHLNAVLAHFDPGLGGSLPASVDKPFLRKMMAGIVAFRMVVDRVEAKFKLGQNKSVADQTKMRAQLLRSARPGDVELGRLIDRIFGE